MLLVLFIIIIFLIYSANLPAKLDGSFKQNEALDKTERLFENSLHWPEAFAIHKGKLTSTPFRVHLNLIYVDANKRKLIILLSQVKV